MSAPSVAFHFDFLSPYAFLAWRRLLALERAGTLRVAYRPTLLAGLLGHHGQLGPAEIPAKRSFLIKDVFRLAKSFDVALDFPATHPFNPLPALRVSLLEVAGADQARVIEAIWTHGWVEGGDLGDPEALIAALDAAGLDGGALMAKTRDPEVKAALKTATAHAIDAGLFGVPTMVTEDGETFFGCDRVAHLVAHLDGSLTIDSARVAQALARPRAAERRR